MTKLAWQYQTQIYIPKSDGTYTPFEHKKEILQFHEEKVTLSDASTNVTYEQNNTVNSRICWKNQLCQ
jgi:hypothetical protein